MTNIWAFLLQTLSVTVTALLLLLMKRIFEDKLSPRWQYGIWTLLALRILLPVRRARYLLVPLSYYVEVMKAQVEGSYSSAYSGVFDVSDMSHVIPVIREYPLSVTDWIFVIYVLGIGLFLLRYLISYLRLRMYLNRYGKPVSEDVSTLAASVAQKYDLPSCRLLSVPGLSTAFVCGIINPLLVVPEDKVPNEKILLHELLHLKYRDAWQSVFWCLLRCLHWCNPILQYAFFGIENDMETLCDQRVLEHLEGEERREYGIILLEMANDRYARTPGTSSISNGGKNVAKRIEAIVRFKKYPKGMALVSVCILVLLTVAVFWGSSYTLSDTDCSPSSEEGLERTMAKLRVLRCGTAMGALDTYAKGLVTDNGVLLAMASPIDKQEEIYGQMLENEWEGWWLDTGADFDEDLDVAWGYDICNLVETEEGIYEGYLSFTHQRYDENGGENFFGKLLVPVRVKNDNGWCVEEYGERLLLEHGTDHEDYPALHQYTIKGEHGTVVLRTESYQRVDNTTDSYSWVYMQDGFDQGPKIDAEADYTLDVKASYDYQKKTTKEEAKKFAGVRIHLIKAGEKAPDEKEKADVIMGGYSGGSDGGSFWMNGMTDFRLENGEGVLTAEGYSFGLDIKDAASVEDLPSYLVQIYWDSECVEEIIVGVEDYDR